MDLAHEDTTPTVTAADVASIDERTLHTALHDRFLDQNKDQSARGRLRREIDALARHGDARAPVIVFLAESMRKGYMRRSMISDRLFAAAERGDAMASFFTALALKGELLGVWFRYLGVGPGVSGLLRAAGARVKEGWADVAEKYFVACWL